MEMCHGNDAGESLLSPHRFEQFVMDQFSDLGRNCTMNFFQIYMFRLSDLHVTQTKGMRMRAFQIHTIIKKDAE